MAYLFRLIALALALFVSSAHALVPLQEQYRGSQVQAWVVGPALACQQHATYNGWTYQTVYQLSGPYGWACQSNVTTFRLQQQYVCPPNSTASGGSCACNAGYVEQGSMCAVQLSPHEQFCLDTAGSAVQTSWVSTSPSLASRTVCSTGVQGYYACNATIEPSFCGSMDGVTYTCNGSGVKTSTTCTPSPTPEQPTAPTLPVTEDPTPPPPGTCPGQINGVTVNVPCTSSATKGTEQSTTNDGAGNVTSKADAKSTTCTAAGSCTTTVTTTTTVNGGSPVVSSKTTTQSKGDFCAQNAGAKECGDGSGSAFGGSCEAGFQCEGDAVQCAHAKETHLQNCKINKDTPERQLYEASKGDAADFDNDGVVNVGPSSFSQAAILGSASCISDKSITVMGSTVSLPFSRVCQYLAMLGNVLMAVGFLLSGRIIMRG